LASSYKKGVGVEKQNNLGNFDYFMITTLLSEKGFKLHNETDFYTEMWCNSNADKCFTIKRTPDKLSREVLFDILNQAGLSIDEFLELM